MLGGVELEGYMLKCAIPCRTYLKNASLTGDSSDISHSLSQASDRSQ